MMPALGSGWRLGLGAGGYIFTGRGDLNFAELEARAVWSLGPARLRAGARFAPVQAAIGGSNLHLSLDGDVGVPGTPVTLMGGLGHSTGTVTEPLRAQRFRPEGAYWNYSLGAEYVAGPAVLGVRWTGNSIGAAPAGPFADPHVGSRLAGYIRLDF